ncbi:hypothetical protein ABTZ03_28990 [Kitasatospora sp. NPDC096077]|uniref:hypothetical protein n=1 Tax=Kitasatospora sp. NPDC096077 TaxID=3155544 RepID=UPI003325ABDC
MSAVAVAVAVSAGLAVVVSVLPLATAGQAARELRLVEIGFVLLLAGCAAGAVALLGVWERKGRGRGGG